jgi:hypothetical protein
MKDKRLFLIIIPALYIFFGNYVQQIVGMYSLRSIDPEYIYYISGLSVANGHLELGHIDNPGTPLQYFVALSFRIIYLFRTGNYSFIEDALLNADMYLTVTNLFLIAFVSAFLFFAGVQAYKVSKKISYSLLVQVTPFFAGIMYSNIGRVTPENMLPIPIVLLSLLLLRIIKNKADTDTWHSNILFASIVALGISIKLTFLPVFIIPLIIIKSWKKRITYTLLSTIFFLIFALPVTLQLKTFWNWTKALFLNSGKYGTGEKNIIDFNTFIPNFIKLWNENEIFFIVFSLFVIVVIASIFFNKHKRNSLNIRLSIALVFSIFIQIIMVCKHFEQRYFVASLFLLPLLIILIFETTEIWHLKIANKNVAYFAIYLFVIVFFTTKIPVVRQLSAHLTNEQEKRMPAYHYLKSIEENAMKILVPGYYNCPSIEYALRFSYGWAGKQKELYNPYLAKLFPNTSIFYFWDNTFNYWGEEPNYKDTNRPIYIYLEHIKHLQKITDVFSNRFPENVKLEQVFYNKLSNESIFRVVVDK